jgi:hypothetical protein
MRTPRARCEAHRMATRPKILGRLLIDAGHLTEPQLEEALRAERPGGERFGETLVRLGMADAGARGQGPGHPARSRLPSAAARAPRRRPPIGAAGPGARAPRTPHGGLTARRHRLHGRPARPRRDRRPPVPDRTAGHSGRVVPEAVMDGIEVAYGSGLAELVESLPDELRRRPVAGRSPTSSAPPGPYR